MPTAVVTGASTGIGREFALICARDGFDLVLVARNMAQLQALAEEIRRKTGRDSFAIAKDLAVPGAARELHEELVASGVDAEILINNAGFGLLGEFWQLSAEEQSRMVQLNVAALTDLCRLFLPGFVAKQRGQILNIASTAAFQPGPLMSVYYATKAYVVSFSIAIANEARKHGVTVSCLCPGPTATEFAERAKMTNTKLFAGNHGMTAAAVAKIGYRGMKRGKPLVIAGRMNALLAFLTRFSPLAFNAAMARRFQE